jgi:uncharacterized protein (TIGR03435 family)
MRRRTFEEFAQNGVRRETVPDSTGGARRTLCAMQGFTVGLTLAARAALAQAPQAAPVAFEVAAIRAAPPITEVIQQIQSGKAKLGMTVDGSRVDIGFVSLADLAGMAYNVKPYQMQGPDWMSQQRFDIQAGIPDGVSKDRVPEMLRALLADRFKMTTHKEKKDLPVYALIAGKNGAKLTEAAALTQAGAAPDKTLADSANSVNGDTEKGQFKFKVNGQNGVVMQSGTMRISSSGGTDGGHMEINRITMPGLANALSSYVDRPVIDMTGLTGEYQVALDLSLEDLMLAAQRAQRQMAQLGVLLPPQQLPGVNPGEASTPGGGSVFAAVGKLGLKLDARKGPVEVIVVDHLEKAPTEN